MDPAILALVVAYFVFRVFRARSPARIILAKPTTIWPIARVAPAFLLAAVAIFLLTRLGTSGAIAVIVGLVVVLLVVRIEKSTTAPLRLIYERGGSSILQWQLIAVVATFALVWAVVGRL